MWLVLAALHKLGFKLTAAKLANYTIVTARKKGIANHNLFDALGFTRNHPDFEQCRDCLLLVIPGMPEVHADCVELDELDEEYDGPYGDDADPRDDEDDECPGGRGQPAGCCTCAELASWNAHQANPDTRGSYWTA